MTSITSKIIADKLKNANTDRQRKALYNLVRWVILHREATYQQITSRINMTFLSQRGYMKQFNNDSKRAYNKDYVGNRYRTDAVYRNQILFNTRKGRIPYNKYIDNELTKVDTLLIDKSIKALSKEMGVKWSKVK